MTGQVEASARQIMGAVLALPASDTRRLIAIAGPPAAGKTTVAKQLVALMNAGGHPTGFVPMDGFHMDNDQLDALGLRSRKGAPETFDLDGFAALVTRLKTQANVPVPLFDRVEDRTLPGAGQVTADQNHVVLEGNYLMFDEPGWRDLASHWDHAVFIEEPLQELEHRLIRRWLDHGLSAQEARARAEANDLPNARRVLANWLAY
ncbi:MAG: phosphoribulokinase [Silicimonas sp.]|nr:phosphoribulokinase [Silicimonas sp.]